MQNNNHNHNNNKLVKKIVLIKTKTILMDQKVFHFLSSLNLIHQYFEVFSLLLSIYLHFAK